MNDFKGEQRLQQKIRGKGIALLFVMLCGRQILDNLDNFLHMTRSYELATIQFKVRWQMLTRQCALFLRNVEIQDTCLNMPCPEILFPKLTTDLVKHGTPSPGPARKSPHQLYLYLSSNQSKQTTIITRVFRACNDSFFLFVSGPERKKLCLFIYFIYI